MKKLISMILILTFAFGVMACDNNSSKKYMQQGKTELENKQYEKSLESFKLAISKDSKNQEAILLSGIIEGYLNCKKYIEESDLDKAKETIDNIDKDYEKYSIKDDIDSLKSEIDDKLAEKEKTNENQQAKAINSDKKVSSKSPTTNKDNKTEKVENNTEKSKQSKNNSEKSNQDKKNTQGTKKKSFSEDQAKEMAKKEFNSNSDLEYIVTQSGVEDGIKYYDIIVKSISIIKGGGSGTVDNIKVFENGAIKYNKGA
ncbi:hypothetical protein [Clostridium frigidicarnis]|uniref:Lipoprotein n=1 Tax=Clostridium frigidicarnis TaxID=84698 RepID=A0A1I1AM94_9CLOT|nr:hypothetical protein [Clostridium frigidicarnis]SFB37520.1 hypothetical protein SAMN04488528_103726 [Clostridium frigidicarnis]